MNVINIKLKSGEDLLCSLEDEREESLLIHDPIIFAFDPVNGPYARKWMPLCIDNVVEVHMEDMYFYSEANDYATGLYAEYLSNYGNKTSDHHSDLSDEEQYLEDIFTATLESKISTKH